MKKKVTKPASQKAIQPTDKVNTNQPTANRLPLHQQPTRVQQQSNSQKITSLKVEKGFIDQYGAYIGPGLVLLAAVIVLAPFLSFSRIYLFKDIGSDSLNISYPYFVHISDYLRENGLLSWSSQVGMGQNIHIGMMLADLFSDFLFLIGSTKLAYWIGYSEFLKITISGIISYNYLKIVWQNSFVASLGCLLYSFCGYFILCSSGWYGQASEVVWLLFLFFAFENLLNNRKWFYIPLAVALFCTQPFQLYIYGTFLLLYSIVRYLDIYGKNYKKLLPLYGQLAGAGIIGLLIGGVLLSTTIAGLIESPRVSGGSGYFNTLKAKPIFAFAEPLQYISLLMRTFSSDLLGTANQYRGWGNYLEGPLTYAGLISLLLAPQFFVRLKGRRLQLYLLALGILILPLIFPYFRYLYFGFTGDYYRWLGLIVALSVIYFAMGGLKFIYTTSKVNLPTLGISLAVLLLILYANFSNKNQLIEPGVRTAVTFFLILYTIILIGFQLPRLKNYVSWSLLVIVAIEMIYMARITTNKRDTISAEEWQSKTGYNDYTNEATAYLNQTDKSFFRVNKDYSSGPAMHASINDAMIQHYRSTINYSSFNQKYYIEFLRGINVITPTSDEYATRWSEGLTRFPILQTVAGVKYYITKKPQTFYLQFGYDSLRTFGDVKVYKNRNYLPLGITYDHFITQPDFSIQSDLQKGITMLRAIILDSTQLTKFSGLNPLHKADTLSNFTFDEYARLIQSRRLDTLTVTLLKEDAIQGSISLKAPKMLFLSIPYDKGWQATVNGHKVDVVKVNYGLIGIYLTAGANQVSLQFIRPYFKEGLLLSTLGILAFGALIMFQRKRPKTQSFQETV